MTRIDSTKTKWRVQYRVNKSRAWMNAGLFETRDNAREQAADYRATCGFGNTRIRRHISGKGRACS